ncbi:MAG: ATP-binding cassette domain-containing protein [Pseudomonadota bacterium]
MIKIHNLCHEIGSQKIIDALTMTIPSSGITALVGPNGAGKSTLLNLIGKILPVQQGSITVDDLDVSKTSIDKLALQLALLEQQSHMVTRLKVREIVSFGRWPHHRGRPTEDDSRTVAETIMLFDLASISDRYLDDLSGGQRQRALVAMCYAQSTPWLLLDEPLNNLDPRYALELMSKLHGISRPESGKGVVVVLHDLNYAAKWADNVVLLKEGRLLATGTREEVLTEEMLSLAFDMAIDVRWVDSQRVVLHHGSSPIELPDI